MNYTVLGVSSGIGVSLFPFGKYVVGNIEGRAIFHSPQERQWHINFKGVPLARKNEEWQHHHGDKAVDVIISSPDCGSGSILRLSRSKEYGDHKKNISLHLFFDALERFKPKFFEFENLPGFWKSFPKEEFQKAVGNYYLVCHEAPVTMWGNSQVNRVRLVIVGIRKDLPYKKIAKYFRLPDYRHKNKVCDELYGDLMVAGFNIALGHVREPQNEMCTIHSGHKIPIHEITRQWNTRLRGKKRWEVDPTLGKKYTTAPGVYRNGKRDYPATARKADRQFDHHGYMLSPRQLARVQGVPDSFRLYLSADKLNYWINKARAAVTKTPPYEISAWFKHKLEKSYRLWKS